MAMFFPDCLPMEVLLENKTSKYPQQSPPRWVIGTGQLGRLRSRAGSIARRGGGGGIMPFSIFVVSVRWGIGNSDTQFRGQW